MLCRMHGATLFRVNWFDRHGSEGLLRCMRLRFGSFILSVKKTFNGRFTFPSSLAWTWRVLRCTLIPSEDDMYPIDKFQTIECLKLIFLLIYLFILNMSKEVRITS